ncbi:MAG TPA: amidohydrolase family protein [Symbiobacteriaceae bacterium]|nr:amidohydrolase family protein [Symbiobacteriaceae bacterium]
MIEIMNARIVTVANGVIENGSVLVNDDGKIQAVGPGRFDTPRGTQVIDAGGRTLTPGIVDAYSHLGLVNQGLGWAGDDADEATEPNTAHVRALDGIYPFDEGLADARSGGVTTAQVMPRATNVLGGEALALKLRKAAVADQLVLQRPTAVAAGLGERPKAKYGPEKKLPATRMGIAAVLREALVKAQEYKPEKARDLKLEALQPVIRRELPLCVAAHRADDIVTAIRIAREFDLKLILLGATEGDLVADLIAEAGAAVAAGPSLAARGGLEDRNPGFHLPVSLIRAGVKTALVSAHPHLPAQYLNIAAGLAAAEGLTDDEAWRAVTLTPAELIGVADRVGSIEAGKDADLVLWDGCPLEIMTRVVWTMVEGKVVYAC